MKKITILEDLDFWFGPHELNAITRHWESGKELEAIAKIYRRDPDEIFLALFHQAREGLTERPIARRKVFSK